MKTLNMLGQPCPIPVVNAQKELAGAGTDGVVVVVDNFAAVQNLEKMAKGDGHLFSFAEDGASQWKVTITNKGGVSSSGGSGQTQSGQAQSEIAKTNTSNNGTENKGPVVLITANSMGRGDEELGKMLIKGFIFSLSQLEPPPQAVIFLNGGAHLTTEGANTVLDLKVLQEKGVGIHTCGTCANYYKLSEKLAVGNIVDMMFISKTMSAARSIITI